ncbi:transcription factor IIIB 90 kDa subunit [Hermetia illucens]|nr:transcription factor IIIB 90 kDa subunit [Hermetia illucens]
MSSGVRCKNCGSTEIEVDNARGDAVCTNCGTVLEDNLIVSEVQFEEVGHGSAAIGQFVSADSSGGATNYGKFQVGSGTESREVTIKKAKNGITMLCQQLQLTNHYMETALNFFKMALARHLTRGRRNTHIYAACVYITCRTEGTSHLLIDISDVLQICCYELGRTYLKLSNALCINIPSVDPCLYIIRFANKLQFGSKTHEVSMTALRIAQRMKKDSLHSGRRPTGLCGAALLIAARMHEYSRTVADIVKIVKIHESTIRKRLSEFADTPSSALTLEEFMAVDLEAEQDPPAFKMARKKDRERLQKLGEYELTILQKEIDAQLERDLKKSVARKLGGVLDDVFSEEQEADQFIRQSTVEAFKDYLADDPEALPLIDQGMNCIQGIKPDVIAMCTPPTVDVNEKQDQDNGLNGELDLEGLDDDEINGYIMSENEAKNKNVLWMKLNEEYLKEMKLKEERLAKEREEGKPEKKRRPKKRRTIGPSNTAGEAIEKMLQEKKISSKINYDILKTLTEPSTITQSTSEAETPVDVKLPIEDIKPNILTVTLTEEVNIPYTTPGPRSKKPRIEMGLPVASEPEVNNDQSTVVENDEVDEDEDAEPEPEPEPEYSSLKDMLNNGEDDEYYGYDDDNY